MMRTIQTMAEHERIANAAGGPGRPKSRAIPAKAAGGKASTAPIRLGRDPGKLEEK